MLIGIELNMYWFICAKLCMVSVVLYAVGVLAVCARSFKSMYRVGNLNN